MDARYSVQVPKNFNAELHTGGGSIEVNEVTGEIRTNTAGGNLKFARNHGPTDARTSGGDVKLADCDGALKIESSGGRIESAGGKGSLDAHTAGGQVSVRDFAGRVDVASKGGQITLDSIAGPLAARTAGGAIHAMLSAISDVKLETSAGAIIVAVPADGGFNVDAQSAIGGVRTDLPVSSDRKDSEEDRSARLTEAAKRYFSEPVPEVFSSKAANGERAAR